MERESRYYRDLWKVSNQRNDVARQIGQNIARIRRAANCTRGELAASIDVSDNKISTIEHGLTCVSVYNLLQIARVLDVTLDDLLEGVKVTE